LAGDPITATLTRAPGNDAPIGGLKVVTASGWFAARPSGTEDIYKIYAESFRDEAHLETIVGEARAIVGQALRDAPPAVGKDADHGRPGSRHMGEAGPVPSAGGPATPSAWGRRARSWPCAAPPASRRASGSFMSEEVRRLWGDRALPRHSLGEPYLDGRWLKLDATIDAATAETKGRRRAPAARAARV
jgi:hypothetical protein